MVLYAATVTRLGVQDIILNKDDAAGKYTSSGGIWGIIRRCIDESWLMGISISGATEVDNGVGLLSGHAYSVLQAKQLQVFIFKG